MELRNWAVCELPQEFDPYKAPELQQPKFALQGQVYGHQNERHYDGKWVTTSRPVAHDGVDTIYTISGSSYKLGQVDKEYEKIYNDAKQRLFASLPRRS